MDRGRKRATGEHGREDPEKTNVSVLILQQVSLFSNWWAAAEEKMSIGLAGRCVFFICGGRSTRATQHG